MENKISVKVGFDIGGTNIKVMAVSDGKIQYKNIFGTATTAEGIVSDIANEYCKLKDLYDIENVGVGTAGSVYNGIVDADNLPLKKIPLKAMLEEKLGIPIKIENDANCAALGEIGYGLASGLNNIVLITLGTGIGGGIVINRQLYLGKKGLSGEIGHMCIEASGRDCPCGLVGCFERYASVTALKRDTKEAVEEHPDSILAKMCSEEGVTGKTVFMAIERNCEIAKKVFDRYLSYLAKGIDSIINIFDPDAVILAGGITKEGDKLLKPLKEKVHFDTAIEISKIQGDAGALGATMLW